MWYDIDVNKKQGSFKDSGLVHQIKKIVRNLPKLTGRSFLVSAKTENKRQQSNNECRSIAPSQVVRGFIYGELSSTPLTPLPVYLKATHKALEHANNTLGGFIPNDDLHSPNHLHNHHVAITCHRHLSLLQVQNQQTNKEMATYHHDNLNRNLNCLYPVLWSRIQYDEQ